MIGFRYISLVLIGLVLACPYQCVVECGFAFESGQKVATCSGCSQDCSKPINSDNPSDESNRNPSNDCDCADCLCRGALLVEEESVNIVASELFSHSLFWPKLESTQVGISLDQLRRHSQAPSVYASALEVRAALCCWLI